MADTAQMSKSAKKNIKKHKKPGAGGKSLSSEDDGKPNPREILAKLKDQLEIAKESKDHARTGKLREQIWVLKDIVAGVRTDMPEDDLAEILEGIPTLSSKKDSPAAPSKSVVTTAVISEPEKRVKSLKKKLDQITKLKTKQENGEKLEENQLQKIKSETELQQELDELEVLIQSTLKLKV